MAWVLELMPDLMEAVVQELLTVREAWTLQDDRMANPGQPYPREYQPILLRLRLMELDPEQMHQA